MEMIGEFWTYMRYRRKYWMLPILIMLGVFGTLIAVTHGTAVAPFIYTIF